MWNYMSVGKKGLSYKVSDFTDPFYFERDGQNEVGNFGNFVL